MSVLSFPRIVINGEISWDPATTNNSLGTGYAKDPVKIDLPPAIEMDDYDDWLTMWNVGGSTNGGWNVYGTHHVVSTAKATNFVTGPGENTTTDPMAGAEFKFVRGTPKLVDTNPYSPVTSQIFLREMICQGDGVGFSGPAEMRMTSRHPFFSRNLSQNLAIAGGMGVIWQTCIAYENIQWIGGDKPPGIIGQLKSMMGKNGVKGLMIRFSAYTTLYFKNFVDGGIVGNNDPRGYTAIAKHWNMISPVNPGNVAGALNPAISTLTGAIGLWQDGDLTTVPSDRMMQAELITNPNADKRFQLGATSAKVNAEQSVVSFDMMNTLPLAKRDNTAAPVGDLHVTAQCGTDTPIPIGVIPQSAQDKENFEANGGILDVQIENTDAASLKDMKLSIASPDDTCTSMQEIDLMAEVDARAVYLDEGDTSSFTVNVTALGGALPTGTKVFAKLLPWPSIATAPSN